MVNFLLLWGIILAALIICVFGIMGILKDKRSLRGGAMPLQDIQQIYDPGVKNVIEIQSKKHHEEDNSGRDRNT